MLSSAAWTEVIYAKSRKHVWTVLAEFRGGFTVSLKYVGGFTILGPRYDPNLNSSDPYPLNVSKQGSLKPLMLEITEVLSK